MERRLAFGTVAELYDAARPSYPSELVDDVLAYAGPDVRDALEVGAGTGKATALFAARGLRITAVEPSSAMAAVASQQAATASVHVLISDFEHAPVQAGAFDLVYSAQAWHWVDPARRRELAARALRPGGVIAAFWNRPDWERCPLRDPLDAAYERAGVSLDDAGPMHPASSMLLDIEDEWSERRVYRWQQRYTREAYLDLMATHSDHILLPVDQRATLFEAVGAVIGSGIELPYATVLGLTRIG